MRRISHSSSTKPCAAPFSKREYLQILLKRQGRMISIQEKNKNIYRTDVSGLPHQSFLFLTYLTILWLKINKNEV